MRAQRKKEKNFICGKVRKDWGMVIEVEKNALQRQKTLDSGGGGADIIKVPW